ncbi:amino acid adenylation domain-containing protein [Chamaesiphon sp. VAR_69_metabat_338]|uniref:non-ribosomal peptide synthetase n=1 Tax=Chamaesiphon sp. VAR_69_metabat_338 TaxID=2964704 RepID=UPI00286E2237|nr:amino acid adenylation domain-containing protein [Chamaesiphon sp. VAR_69_metabat_338]
MNSARKGVPIQPVSRNGVLPLSFAQQRFWFIEQLSLASAVNNLRVAFRLTGQLNVTALERSLREIVRRHEILRTTFHLVDGKSAQSIDPDAVLILPIVDLQNLSEIEREQAARQQLQLLAQQPFDLERGPLLRVELIRLAPEIHQLILVVHHIIGDGISIEICLQELTVLYTAFCANKPSPLKDLTIQYADFASWQHRWVASGILATQLEYWQQQLQGSLPILQLPTDRPHPRVQTARGAYQFLEVPQTISDALKSLSKAEGVTLFMTLLAAFGTLLYRSSGQEDILVGTPIAGRSRQEIDRSIGCFINTLVLRTNLADNPSFQELLGRVRQVTLGAYAHQALPFEQLIAALNLDRDLSRSPLFQVMFIFEHNASTAWTLPGLTVTEIEVPSTTANFDLTLDLQETATGIEGGIEYNTDLFDAATIERTIGHFQTLLAAIVANPAQRIADLPLLTPAERQQLLGEWNDTKVDDARQLCIHQLFEAQVARTPTAIAVVCEDDKITYAQLNRRANQLADRLQHAGVTANVLVGILMERSIEMVVALLGILKAGGAYVPLDPHYPPARISYMLADADVKILVTQSELRSHLPSPPDLVICLDSDWQLTGYSPENLDREVRGENLAYAIYTSGSTGQPKGVAVEHRNLVNFLHAMRPVGLTSADTMMAVTTICFDIAALELYLPLIIGAKVAIVARAVTSDAHRLFTELVKSQATVMQATPATWQLLLAGGWDANYPLKVLCGGEALPNRLAHQILATGSKLWNLYGPTETTVWSTIAQVHATNSIGSTHQTLCAIGRPIANTQIYILDKQLQPVPIGVHGELYIGGAGVVRGYLNRPKLTAEKFIPNPFSTVSSARIYKTGDLARYASDGNIEFLGRIDDLVKVRGFRIELGEIETVLAQHSLVDRVVAIAREITPGSKSLIAYIVPHRDLLPTTSELRSFLGERLPEYMVPSVFVILETFPLTANGKIDRQALPLPDRASLEPAATFVPPQDGLELQLTKIWERVLGIQSIGTRDNFFELGGHSLLAVQLFAAIAKTFGTNLPLATLFHSPTIEQLATILRQSPGATTWSSLVPIAARGSKPPLFCAHPVGGNVLEYYPLAAYLGAEQPIYGLQSLGLDGVQAPLTRIEDMAARYIREIQTVQPQGPYYLIGYSFGALVAFEIACQLEQQGETIGLLASIDNAAPSLSAARPPLLPTIGIHLRNLYQLDMLDRVKYIQDRIVFRTRYQYQQNSDIKFLIDRWDTPLPPEYLKVLVANFQAAEKYAGKSYRGNLTLFRAGVQSLERALHPDLGWGKLVSGEVEIHNLRGHHNNLWKGPYIQVLADKLRLALH